MFESLYDVNAVQAYHAAFPRANDCFGTALHGHVLTIRLRASDEASLLKFCVTVHGILSDWLDRS